MVPIRIFLIKLLTIAAQEQKREEGKQYAPKCSPHRQVINNGRTTHLILQLYGRKLHIEGYCIRVIGIVVDHRDFLEDRLDC